MLLSLSIRISVFLYLLQIIQHKEDLFMFGWNTILVNSFHVLLDGHWALFLGKGIELAPPSARYGSCLIVWSENTGKGLKSIEEKNGKFTYF